jgi:hypothetical protein
VPVDISNISHLQSLANPDDPVLAALRKEGILMRPAYCNGTLFLDSYINARIHQTNGPMWLTEESSDAAVALTAAAAVTGNITVNQNATVRGS